MPVRLYHGTSRTSAGLIEREGFQPFDPQEVVAALAAEFGVDESDLRTEGRSVHALAVTQDVRTRGGWACFAASESAAWGWASRGPETRWELLRAIWKLQGHDPWDRRFDGWRRLQFRDIDPAVVVVEAPRRSVRGIDGGDPDPLFQLWAELGVEPSELWLEAPVPSAWVTDVYAGKRRVYRMELEAILDVDRDGLDAAIAASGLCAPEMGARPDETWWTWEQVESAGLIARAPAS